jgi:hypothetical protein
MTILNRFSNAYAFFSVILSLLIFFSKESKAQSGTVVISIVYNDNIILAADSRASFFLTDDINSKPYAYCDSFCKIFKLKDYYVGIAGTSEIGTLSISSIVSHYNQTAKKNKGVEKTMLAFWHYLTTTYDTTRYPEVKDTKMLGVGFDSITPVIFAIDFKFKKTANHGALSSEIHALKYISQDANLNLELYPKIEKMIQDYAQGENKTLEIGGPTSILLLKPNNVPQWIQNNFSNRNFATAKDFYNLVKDGKVKVNYLVPNGKEYMLKNLRR